MHAGPCVHVTALNPPAMFRNPAAPLLGTRNADCCQTPPRCRVGALDRARLTQRARPRRAARKLVAGGLATGIIARCVGCCPSSRSRRRHGCSSARVR